jgi:hypothetical protein
MANDFDKQKKREREREEVEKAARDLADDIRSSSLISNHDPKIAVSVGGWVDGDAAQYNSTRTNPEDRVHGWRGGWVVETAGGMTPFPTKESVVSQVQAWVQSQAPR